MRKLSGAVLLTLIAFVFISQVVTVSAHEPKKPITSPITSPITGPTTCKPGWGFGDKNHCHFKFQEFFNNWIHSFNHHNDHDKDHDNNHGNNHH